MRYPSAKKLKEMDLKLKDVEGVQALPKNATYIDQVKYELCKKMVAYLRINRMTQAELAELLSIDPARISEIIHYKIEKFTIDTLLGYNRILDAGFEIEFKSAI